MVLGLTAGLGMTSPVLGRVAASAHSFQRQFREMNKAANSLSPIERFVFSLILADGGCTRAKTQPPVADPRT